MRKYNYKNWIIGERVRPNPNFDWSSSVSKKFLLESEGTVIGVGLDTLKVQWSDGIQVYYSYADSSLIKVSKYLIDEELFDI